MKKLKKIKTKSEKHILGPVKPNNCILGLDCSSSVLGWGLIDIDTKELMAYGYYNLASSKYPIMERLDYLYKIVTSLGQEFAPKKVVIEEIVKFMKGRSSAATIISLTAFNRAAALSAYHSIGNVEFMNVNTIRKIIRVATKHDGKILKEEMPNVIKENLYSELKYYKKRTTGWTDQTYDQSDGIATAWAFCLQTEVDNASNK